MVSQFGVLLTLCLGTFGVLGNIKLRHLAPYPLLTFNDVYGNSVWGYIFQKVDNFNKADERTWEMRYISLADFYQAGGPMIIYLGGEWEISEGILETGLIADIGRQHNGYMFYTEHRYFGDSQPLNDWSTESLKYLTVGQALADVAYFIEHIKTRIPTLKDSKVVVCGTSYSATLATWMRLKYPHLVDAAWASSAPLVAQVDYPEYYEVIGKAIRKTSEECYFLINSASDQIIAHMQTEWGRSLLSDSFYTCSELKGYFPYDQFFWDKYTDYIAGLVQISTPQDVEYMCEELMNSPGDNAMEKIGFYLSSKNDGDCLWDYDDYIEVLASTYITNTPNRQWYYLICTEFFHLQTTTSPNQPFGNYTLTPRYFRRLCEDLFGLKFASSYYDVNMEEFAARTNRMYGGRNNALTKVVSIHGSLDPWHPTGILESLHDLAPAMLVEGYAHCQDTDSIRPSDSEQMQKAKQLVLHSIAKWIQ